MPGTASAGVALFHDPVFQAFAAQRPVAVMAQLALRHLLDDAALRQVFQTHAQTQREDVIPFAALTQLLASVVLSQEPSVNAGIRKMARQLGASHQAVYGKLRRVEASTMRGLVRYSFDRVAAAQQALPLRRCPDVPGWQTRIIDGNHLAATDHRLKETRDSTAAPLPGKMLVVYSPRHDAVVDCFPIEDGHAQERSAFEHVLATVRAGQLWVADRNFCTLGFLYGVAAAQAAFLVRQHGQLCGTPVGKLRKVGRVKTGVAFEQKLRLPAYAGQSRTIRRVVVRLDQPTRDGDRELVLLTNLPQEQADARAVAGQYQGRWRIEAVMQRLTECLRCEIKPLCYPKAALFGFAVALVMYNTLALVLAVIEAAHGRQEAQALSYYYLALEVAQATDGLLVALALGRWEGLSGLPPQALAEALLPIAQGMRLAYYQKSTRGPKKAKPKPTHARRNVHVSTMRVLAERRGKPC